MLGSLEIAPEACCLTHPRFVHVVGCTGVAALIVMVYPMAAVFGLFLGGLPGIFLGLAPSLFIYFVAWWGLQWLTRKLGEAAGFDSVIWHRWIANLVPVGIILVFAFTIPRVINAPHEREIERLQA